MTGRMTHGKCDTTPTTGHISPELQKYINLCKEYHVTPDASASIVFNNLHKTQRLHLGKHFTKGGMLPLGDMLRNDNTITMLDFRGAKIGSTGCLVIQAILEENKTITSLNLSYNRIDKHGVESIAKGLAKNNTLKELIMRGNHMDFEGAVLLAKGLKKNKSIEHLDVSNNSFGFTGAVEIMKAVEGRKVEIDFSGNYVREEVINSVTHGFGMIMTVIGGFFLIEQAAKQSHAYYVSCWIFIISLGLMYLNSTLAHSFFMMKATGAFFEVLDHTSISILIAGTYTPFTLVSIGHWWLGPAMCITIWILAVNGVILSLLGKEYRKLELISFLVMGWVSILAAYWVWECVPTGGIVLVAAGGVLYTVGVYFFVTGQTVPINHAIWHVFVLFASACHYFAIYWYVRPICAPIPSSVVEVSSDVVVT